MGLRPIGVGLGAEIWGRCSVGPVPNSGVGIWGCGPHLGGADPVLSSSSGVGGEGSGWDPWEGSEMAALPHAAPKGFWCRAGTRL